MIGIDETDRDYGVVVITAHGYVVETLSPLRTGYSIRDFQNRLVGRVKTRSAGLLSAAAKFLWWKPEWEERPNQKFQLISPSYHGTVERSDGGYSGAVLEKLTADAEPGPEKQIFLPAEPDLYLAQVRVEHLIDQLHGHQMPPAPSRDISAIDIGFAALEFAIFGVLGLLDSSLGACPGEVSKLARVLDEFGSRDIDLTPLVHCNVAAEVKRTLVAIHRRDWSISPYATDLIHSCDDKLYGFRQQFTTQPWSDIDYIDFVWRKLIRPVQQQQKYPSELTQYRERSTQSNKRSDGGRSVEVATG
jgi:hypothetical protein